MAEASTSGQQALGAGGKRKPGPMDTEAWNMDEEHAE